MFRNVKISLYFVLLLFFIAFKTSSQTIQWQNTIGGNDTDWADFIELTTDGNYISGGYSYSNISRDKTENSRGASDFWLFKIDDISGSILWQKTIGGNSTDYLIKAKETIDGGFILGGYSSSGISGEKSENSRGYDDYWVVKLDANRNVVWDKTYGGTGVDRLTSIIQTDDGGYLMGGTSDSNISGEKSENSRGDIDMWVIKINSSGTIMWQKTFGGSAADLVESMLQTPNGDFILAGSSHSNISGDKTENSRGSGDYWVLKINSSGSIIWQKTIGGDNGDYAKSIVKTADGHYMIGGTSFSNISGDKNQNTISYSDDVWLIKLNDNGEQLWQKNIGANNTDTFSQIRTTSDNGYILGIMSYSGISGAKTEPSKGDRDYWIVKLDSNGNFEWDKTVGGSSLDQPQSIVESKDGGYVTVGWSRSDISGDKTENKSGLQDFWVVKIKTCTQNPTASSNSPVCEAETLELKASGGTNYSWIGPNGFTSTVQNPTITNAVASNSGEYSCLITGTGGCDDIKKINVVIRNTPAPTAEANQSFCSGSNPTLATIQVTGNSIKWYDSASIGSLLPTTTNLQDGKTYYASQTVNTCEGPRLGVTVSIVNTPLAPTQNTNLVFCKNENATLDNIQISGQNLKWYSSNIAAGILPSNTLLENNTTYYVSQTIGCESDRTPILVQVNDTPLPTANGNQQFCIDENATIATIAITGTAVKWYDSQTNGTLLLETVLLQDGMYYASQTLNNCESERLAVSVKIQDTPIPIADSPQAFCIQKNTLVKDIGITGQNIKWFENTSSTLVLSESTPLENGYTYYATQTVNNCESYRIPVTISILEATDKDCINLVDELPFPKFFTPNNDGYNDTWTVDYAYLAPNSSIRIFDRYGKFIKELSKNTSWDGSYIGNDLPASDYWFTVTAVNGKEYRGHFSLKR
jgi:gliding motility-associated-like protein